MVDSTVVNAVVAAGVIAEPLKYLPEESLSSPLDALASIPAASWKSSIVWSIKSYLDNDPLDATLNPRSAMSPCNPESSNAVTASLARSAALT